MTKTQKMKTSKNQRTHRLVQTDFWGNVVEESEPPRNSIVPLDFAEHRIRMVFIRGEPWWVAADVCRVLGLDNASLVVKGQQRTRRDGSRYWSGGLDEDEWGIHTVNTPSGEQQMLCVNESGLYVLIFKSQRPEAKRFRKWVTAEVLPEIRRTGTYSGQTRRINKEIKRLGVDPETAKARCEQFEANKRFNRELADDGACPRDFAAGHNAYYEGLSGNKAPELRSATGLRPWETPLDRMGYLPLTILNHSKAISAETVRAMGGNLPLEARCHIYRTTTHELAMADLHRLGPGFHFGIKEESGRGKVFDLVRNELPMLEDMTAIGSEA